MTIDPDSVPCACSALRMVARAVSRHYEACLAPTGTTATQYSILRHIQRNGPSPLRPMADALELERTSLYRAVVPLERDGLIELRSDPADRRVKHAHLTSRGVERIEEVRPHWKRAQTSFLATVGLDNWNAVADNLTSVRASMSQTVRPEESPGRFPPLSAHPEAHDEERGVHGGVDERRNG